MRFQKRGLTRFKSMMRKWLKYCSIINRWLMAVCPLHLMTAPRLLCEWTTRTPFGLSSSDDRWLSLSICHSESALCQCAICCAFSCVNYCHKGLQLVFSFIYIHSSSSLTPSNITKNSSQNNVHNSNSQKKISLCFQANQYIHVITYIPRKFLICNS